MHDHTHSVIFADAEARVEAVVVSTTPCGIEGVVIRDIAGGRACALNRRGKWHGQLTTRGHEASVIEFRIKKIPSSVPTLL